MTAIVRNETSNPVTTAEPGAPVSDGGSLLPDPGPYSGGALSDAMSCIYAVLSQLRVLDVHSGQQRVAENKTQQDAALADEMAAFKRQEANEAGSGRGLFSSIGHLVTDVCGDLVHGEAVQAIGAVESDVRDAWNSPKFWEDVVKGLKVVAEAAAVLSAIPGVGAAADAVEEAATVGVDLAGVRGGYFAAEVVDARADATGAQHDVDSLQTVAGWTMDDLKASDQSYGRALDDVRGAIKIRDQTRLEAASIAVRA